MTTRNILLIDDEELLTELFAHALRQAGYTIFRASSGKKALAQLAANPCQLIFSDINLPDIDGVKLCQKIAAKNPGAKIYAMTGDIYQLEQHLGPDSPFTGLLAKPLGLTSLLEIAAQAWPAT